MKKYLLVLVIGLLAGSLSGHAQFTRYIIRLKDKGTNPYSIGNPSQYLTARSIQRRTRYNIAIDSTDLPITPRYIDSIRLAGAVTILNASKWLNQVAIQTSDAAALIKINGFPFVLSTNPIGARGQQVINPVNKELDVPNPPNTNPPPPPQNPTDYYNYGQSYGQVHLHNGEFLHNHGFRGQGMQMAILDAGFFHYLSLPTFDSIRSNNQVLGTWDFVAGNASVDEDNSHGMNCLSTIAANMPGIFMGTAPKTSFYLYRTEDVNSEYPIEEQNWAAGIERADSLGIDVTSTSLGYNQFDNAVFNHTYADMNGHTTLNAKAAMLAAKKGILLNFAAGNEGTSAWHYIITAADADSVIAVGAVNTSGAVGSFSSYGPSSDGRIKPELAAVGVNAVVANPSTGLPGFGSGTSFACPNLAGLTVCFWQAFPEVGNMGILNALKQSANRYSNPDNRTGYGIPDMKKAFVLLIKQLYSQQVTTNNCNTVLQWTAKTDTTISVVVERKLPTDINYLAINTQGLTGAFLSRNFTYIDDLTGVPTGTVKYRFRMNISADTSFFLDSASVNHSINCQSLPVLTATSVSGFGALCLGVTSAAASFTLTGANLPASNVQVGPQAGYSFSTTQGVPFTPSLSLAQPGGSYNQVIYVKFSPVAAISYDGNITVTCGSASSTIAVTGSGINTIATMTTGAAISVTTHDATLAGKIIAIGCSAVSNYGIEYSTANNFPNGSGTKIAATNNIAGDYSILLNALSPNTTYYYKAYGTNNGGNAYGNQLSFTTLPIPNALTIYNSPVTNTGVFHYSINGIAAGNYAVLIFNSAGQTVFKKEMNVAATFIDERINLPVYLAAGVYTLQLTNTATHAKDKKSFLVR